MTCNLSIDEAVTFLHQKTERSAGQYFAVAGSDLTVGTGVIYGSVTVPFYDNELEKFRAAKQSVIVLTHECDLDRGNDKIFNNDVLVVPVINFENIFHEITKKRNTVETKAYIGDLVNGNISQLMYLPPWNTWKNGGVVALNRIIHTSYKEFLKPEVSKIGALTGFGLSKLDEALSRHFFRPKVDRLPLSGAPGHFYTIK